MSSFHNDNTRCHWFSCNDRLWPNQKVTFALKIILSMCAVVYDECLNDHQSQTKFTCKEILWIVNREFIIIQHDNSCLLTAKFPQRHSTGK